LAANFNTAVLENERWIVARSHIAKRYLQSWFWIDLPSSLPVDLIMLFLKTDSEHGSKLKMLRGLRLFRLLRLLKLLKLNEYIAVMETSLGINLKVLKLLKIVASLIFLMHMLGCFWFYLQTNIVAEDCHDPHVNVLVLGQPGEVPDHCRTWLTEYDGGSGFSAPTDIQYIYSVYWALTTLTTVGYGDITPTNDAERVYTLIALLIGALVFGYLMTSVGDLVANLDNRANMVNEKLDNIQELILHHRLPPSLATRVRSYTEYYYSKQSMHDPSEVLTHLSPALGREVREFFLSKSIEEILLLRKYPKEFKLELHPSLSACYMEASEIILEKGRLPKELYFMRKGEVQGLSHSKQMLFKLSDPGRTFDEHCLLQRSCPFSYVAITRCELYTMPTEVLIKAVRSHLNEQERARLLHDVIKECCRINRVRAIYLRLNSAKQHHAAGGESAARAASPGSFSHGHRSSRDTTSGKASAGERLDAANVIHRAASPGSFSHGHLSTRLSSRDTTSGKASASERREAAVVIQEAWIHRLSLPSSYDHLKPAQLFGVESAAEAGHTTPGSSGGALGSPSRQIPGATAPSGSSPGAAADGSSAHGEGFSAPLTLSQGAEHRLSEMHAKMSAHIAQLDEKFTKLDRKMEHSTKALDNKLDATIASLRHITEALALQASSRNPNGDALHRASPVAASPSFTNLQPGRVSQLRRELGEQVEA